MHHHKIQCRLSMTSNPGSFRFLLCLRRGWKIPRILHEATTLRSISRKTYYALCNYVSLCTLCTLCTVFLYTLYHTGNFWLAWNWWKKNLEQNHRRLFWPARGTADFSKNSHPWWCDELCFLTVTSRSIERWLPSHALHILSVQVFYCQVFAPAYAMAFFHAHKKRKALEFPFIGVFPLLHRVKILNRFSWSDLRQCHGAWSWVLWWLLPLQWPKVESHCQMPLCLPNHWFSIEVKRMPYPYRAILDAGVCAGLSWGMGFCLRFDASKANFQHIEPILMDFPRCHSLHLCQVCYHWKGTGHWPAAAPSVQMRMARAIWSLEHLKLLSFETIRCLPEEP